MPAPVGVTLTHSQAVAHRYGGVNAPQRVRLVLSDAEGLPAELFLFRKTPWGASGEPVDEYVAVVSPFDIDTYPVADPTPGQSPAEYYRAAEVDVFVATPEEAVSLVEATKSQLASLVAAYRRRLLQAIPESRSPGTLYTHLEYDSAPASPRVVYFAYEDELATDAQAEAQAAMAEAANAPLVLFLRHDPADPGTAWYADTERDTSEVYVEAVEAMTSRLRAVSATGVRVGLWSRPAQEGLLPAFRNALHDAVYAQRVLDASEVIADQDFLAVELYLPVSHATALGLGETWPLREWVQRGLYWGQKHREQGVQSMLVVSVNPADDSSEGLVPPAALESVVTSLLDAGYDVAIRGGRGMTWDAGEPTGAVVAELVGL